MHYIIYKTTNLVNGMFYTGKHQTNDLNDGYVGSGKRLKRAIKKYGLDNFKTEILEMCPTEAHMNLAEKIYVVVDRETSYNLCPGGHGGFGYINENILNNSNKNKESIYSKNSLYFKEKYNTIEYRLLFKKNIENRIANGEKIKKPSFSGRKHSHGSIEKIKLSKKDMCSGDKNSQFGTCWITNGSENKKIKTDDINLWISRGYRKGRKIKL